MRRLSIAACVGLAAVVAACRPAPSPVGSLTASPSEIRLPWPQFAELEIRLQATSELPEGVTRPHVFVHVLDEPGSVLRTFDHPLPGEWTSGRRYDYSVRLYQSALAEPLAAGDYMLTLGLYALEGGRYALQTGGEEVARNEYRLATVVVPPAAENDPRARFSESWLPAEPGADRQILVRRTLRGGTPGTLQFGPLAGPGTLFLNLELPRGEATRRVELLDGGGQPKVALSTSCGGEQVEVSGQGTFNVDLQVQGDEAPAACEVTVQPNFQVTHSDRAETTAVRLGVLAWRPEGVPSP